MFAATSSPVPEASAANDSSADPITDLRDNDYVAFIKTYQDYFDTYRLTPPSPKYGAQKRWICKTVMGEFQHKFGAASVVFVDKVDQYLRNHSVHRVKNSPPLPTKTAPSPRSVPWIHIMGLDKKDTTPALRAAEGVNLHARQEVADSLSEAEIAEYKMRAEAETQARKTPPTPAAIFDWQLSIINRVSSSIQKNFGWEVGQLGNIVSEVAVEGLILVLLLN